MLVQVCLFLGFGVLVAFMLCTLISVCTSEVWPFSVSVPVLEGKPVRQLRLALNANKARKSTAAWKLPKLLRSVSSQGKQQVQDGISGLLKQLGADKLSDGVRYAMGQSEHGTEHCDIGSAAKTQCCGKKRTRADALYLEDCKRRKGPPPP